MWREDGMLVEIDLVNLICVVLIIVNAAICLLTLTREEGEAQIIFLSLLFVDVAIIGSLWAMVELI